MPPQLTLGRLFALGGEVFVSLLELSIFVVEVSIRHSVY